MRASRVSEKPSLCLALMGGIFAALLSGCGDERKSPAVHGDAANAIPTIRTADAIHDDGFNTAPTAATGERHWRLHRAGLNPRVGRVPARATADSLA